MRLDPGARLVGGLLRRLPGTNIATMSHEDIRRSRRGVPRNALTTPVIGRLAHGVAWEDRVLSTTAGYLPVRCYRPTSPAGEDAALPVVAHFHGGGWVLGNLDSGDWLCSHVAAGVGALVVSVDYHLAPEHPFPAAVEECVAVTTRLARHADELGGDGSRLAVMGDSAGGNLAAVVALAARDAGGPPLRCQVLLYPGTDATLASPSIAEHADAPILTRDDIEAFLAHYVGDGDRRDPRVSPLLAEAHEGLAPALIQTAEHDPLRDDGRRYAEALRVAGVPVRHTEYLGAPHGYINLPGAVRSAPQARHEIIEELRLRLS